MGFTHPWWRYRFRSPGFYRTKKNIYAVAERRRGPLREWRALLGSSTHKISIRISKTRSSNSPLDHLRYWDVPVSRLDFIVDLATGKLLFNELNAFPGSCSFYLWVRSHPRVLYTTLIHNMIETALMHHATAASLDRNIGLKALRA